ncbi:hypothetical protein GY45DRAFT_1303929 [Cubamyces sp. BRFM 1775]|nr:hypothetical protein GY45DRAFT_1303929 [Cubamyces sp. BRFM 1775]
MPNNRPAPSSNSTLPMEGAVINELYYTGQGDPRHKCVAIGYHRNEPVVYKFDTVDLPQGTRTTVTYNEQSVVAFFDWALATHLGAMIRGGEREPMTDLVMPGSTETARMFTSGRDEKEKFEWRRIGDKHPYGYELFSLDPESRIARYDPTPRELPRIGRAYALLEYGFHEDNLIRDALLALCLNRWIDWRGM